MDLWRNVVPWFPGDAAPAQPLSPPRAPENDMTGQYNTPLSPEGEQGFQKWVQDQNLGANHSYDYDMRGVFAKNGPVEHLAGEHFTDEFKKPNHPTFSTGSIYHGVDGNEGGQWVTKPDGTWDFAPSATNLQNLTGPQLWNYFGRVEPRNQVQLPGVAQPPDVSVGPFDQLRRPSQLSAVDIYRQGVGLPTAAEEARQVAALRMANAVHPGLAAPPSPTGLEVAGEAAGRLLRAPFEGVGQGADAMRRVYEGELNPLSPEGIGEAFQAGAQTLGAGMPVAPKASGATLGTMLSAPLFHGSEKLGLDTLKESVRGPLGPGVYTSPAEQIAGHYAGGAGKIYNLPDKPRDVFLGHGHRSDAEWFGFKSDKQRLIDAAEPDKREAVAKILEPMWSNDGYPAYQRLMQLYRGDEGAQALFKKAGFHGVSGLVDGPEVLLFGEQSLK